MYMVDNGLALKRPQTIIWRFSVIVLLSIIRLKSKVFEDICRLYDISYVRKLKE